MLDLDYYSRILMRFNQAFGIVQCVVSDLIIPFRFLPMNFNLNLFKD